MTSPKTMSDDVFPASDAFQEQALVSGRDAYQETYDRSIKDPDAFWAEQAERLDWIKKWDSVSRWDFEKGEVAWFEGGKLNVAYNCLDRHLNGPRRNKAALIWEGDSPNESKTLTYQQLHREVCRFANVLKRHGVKKGDRVTIYLPMILELPIAMLACARIGAVHTVVFGGFSSKSLKERINDCGSKIVITADQGRRGGRVVPLKENVDRALEDCPDVARVIVARNTGTPVEWNASRDKWWHTELNDVRTKSDCPPEPMDAEDPLFILYTSGSTGKPKGVLHTTAGYLLHTAYSHEVIFDLKEEDTFWCTADMGWVTGHSYVTYGPLANGATSLVFEGVPNYPDYGRFWDVVDKHHVTILYTAPTAIRAIAKAGDELVKKRDRSSLRLLGSVGEPINPQAWRWYHDVVGEGRCPIVDTWWQTETGGILISAIPGAIPQKPGSATLPFFGIEPAILDTEGNEIVGPGEGSLVMKTPWPGLMRGVYGEPDRFRATYFHIFPGYYFSGDGARRDEDGYYWITGRIDDVINVSGHRMGTAEIESALVAHDAVAEAAVVGYPHDVKGQGIYAYITVNEGVHPGAALEKELIAQVRNIIGPVAAPDVIHFSPNLPKTRSGKIMRRLLRKIAAAEFETLGDLSTLSDPSVIDTIIEEKKNRYTP